MPRKRAPNGSGTITTKANGKKQARVSVGRDKTTGKPIYSYGTFETEAEARKWITKTQAEIDRGVYVKPSKMTMNEWLDCWLETCTGNYADVSMAKSRVKNYIRPYLGTMKAAELAPSQIMRAYQAIRTDYQKEKGKPISEKTIKNIHALLSSIMLAFVDDGGRMENPCKYVSHRLPKAERKELPQLTEAELSAVLKLLPTSPYGNLFALAIFTGMRQGELLGLHWADVDFSNKRLIVRGQLHKPTAKGEKYEFTPTKNGKKRDIYLTNEAIEALQRERKRQNIHRLRAGSAWNESDLPGLVFTNETGGHWTHETIYRNFKKLLKKADVTLVRFHDTRHIFTALSFASGADPVTTQEQLGHATAKFTQEVYAYSPNERKRRTADALGDYIVKNLLAGGK